jgi:hypothetical protein
MVQFDVQYPDERDGRQSLYDLDLRIKSLKRRMFDLKTKNAILAGQSDDFPHDAPVALELSENHTKGDYR